MLVALSLYTYVFGTKVTMNATAIFFLLIKQKTFNYGVALAVVLTVVVVADDLLA